MYPERNHLDETRTLPAATRPVAVIVLAAPPSCCSCTSARR